jgi:hypothetical protein
VLSFLPCVSRNDYKLDFLSGIAIALEALREQRRSAFFYQLCDQSPCVVLPSPFLPLRAAHPACAAARQHMLARDYAEASSRLDAFIQACAASGSKPPALASLLSGMRRGGCSVMLLLLTFQLPSGICALRSKCEAEAALCFRDALSVEPCCIEAVPELIRLGAKEEDVRALLQVPPLSTPPSPSACVYALTSRLPS